MMESLHRRGECAGEGPHALYEPAECTTDTCASCSLYPIPQAIHWQIWPMLPLKYIQSHTPCHLHCCQPGPSQSFLPSLNSQPCSPVTHSPHGVLNGLTNPRSDVIPTLFKTQRGSTSLRVRWSSLLLWPLTS